MFKTRTLVFSGLLIAMHIIFARFLAYQSDTIRISFEFLPLAISGILFGPVVAAITGAVADVLGVIIRGMNYFPGFTLSAALTGVIYALFLYRKKKSFIRIAAAVIIIQGLIDVTLNTYWLTILLNKSASVFFIPRLIKSLVMTPIQIAVIFGLWKAVGTQIESRLKGQD